VEVARRLPKGDTVHPGDSQRLQAYSPKSRLRKRRIPKTFGQSNARWGMSKRLGKRQTSLMATSSMDGVAEFRISCGFDAMYHAAEYGLFAPI